MQWFKDLPVARKLALGFSVLIALTLVVGGTGAYTARSTNRLLDDMYVRHAVPALAIKEANINLIYVSRAVRNAILDDDADAPPAHLPPLAPRRPPPSPRRPRRRSAGAGTRISRATRGPR